MNAEIDIDSAKFGKLNRKQRRNIVRDQNRSTRLGYGFGQMYPDLRTDGLLKPKKKESI